MHICLIIYLHFQIVGNPFMSSGCFKLFYNLLTYNGKLLNIEQIFD